MRICIVYRVVIISFSHQVGVQVKDLHRLLICNLMEIQIPQTRQSK